MVVTWHLIHGQGDRLLAARLCERVARTHVHRNAALQIRQRKGRLAVAAIGRADQVEQGLVLGNRYQLALAEGPAGRRKIAGKHANFAHIWTGHESLPV
jgi:hypothetical protein